MQIIIKRMTLSDLICNIFYKIRYRFYNMYLFDKLKNKSPLYKNGYLPTFVDDFEEESWGTKNDNKLWLVGEQSGMFHPDYTRIYYGPPTIINGTGFATFTVKYKPRTFPDDYRTGNPVTIPYEATRISTPYSLEQSYGRFECRCTLPKEKGTWPSFWLYGQTWPPEIDVFETYGGKNGKTNNILKLNLHYGFTHDKTKSELGAWGIKIDNNKLINNVFHEYAVEWTSTKIEFFIDGLKVFIYSRKDILDKYFNTKMRIVMNHSIEDKYIDKDDKDYYSEFKVDYVRAYDIRKGDN
jgi:Glycosyl hydrolases family 16